MSAPLTIKQFDLSGIGSDVQFGKGGTKINSAAGAFNLYAADDSTLVNVRIAEPVLSSDAATKNYVDNAIQGLDVKSEVQVATTANITLSGLQTIDGYTTLANDRVLVKNQTDATQNGIYNASSSAWTRATDASTGAELASAFVFVRNGTSEANTGWTQTTNPPITIGTSPIVWAQFSGAGTYTAGSGLTLTGSSFSANVDNVTTSILSNNIVVANGTAGQTLISAGSGVEAAWGSISLSNGSNAISGTLSPSNGGTGLSSLTAHGVVIGEGTGAVNTVVGATNQVLLGNTGADPSFGSINLTSMVGSSILPLANGGTNASLTATAGGITYGTGTALSVSAAGTSGQVLVSGGAGAPSWSSIGSIAVTTASNEGGGYGWFDASNSTSSSLTFKTLTNNDSSLTITANSTTIDIGVNQGDLNLNNLSGTLDVTKGGTGLSSIAANSILYTSATNVLAASNITSLALTLLGDSTTSAMQSTLGLVIGTDVQAHSSVLDGVSTLSGTGLVVQTGSNTFTDRSILNDTTAGLEGIYITNGDGVSGSPTIGLAIQNLVAEGSANDSMLVPVFDGTNNKSVTISQIIDLVPSADPLFLYQNGLTATTTLTASLPTNARVGRVCVEVVSAFGSDGITITSASGFMASDYVSSYVDMTAPGIYIIDLAASAVSSGAVTVTITGTGGSCNVNMNYNILA